jgi:hypothetical protein
MPAPIAPLPVYLTAAAIARRTGCCPATLRRRVEAGKVAPDAVVIAGTVGESFLFRSDRLADIRLAIRTGPEIVV